MSYSVYILPNYKLLLFAFIILIPLLIDRYLDAQLIKNIFISTCRMAVQLILVGFYLSYVFKWNNIIINLLWILIMIAVTNYTILDHVGLKLNWFFIGNYCVLVLTVLIIQTFFLIVFKPDVFFSSRYIIPLEGMILGNLLKCNIIGMDRFFSEVRTRKDEYILYVSLGANHNEALKPFWNSAYRAAVKPQLAALSTMGLVALPGMMTGQLLGGSDPIEAVKYQILILLAIFTSASFSVFLNLYYSKKIIFDRFGRVKENIFK